MIERILLVAWKGSQATEWVDALRVGGYTVYLEDTTGERAWRTAKERGIHAIIIDGEKKPSYGKATGHSLRDTQKTRDIPIIWTNLDTENASEIRSLVQPDLLLDAPTDAQQTLDALRTLRKHADDQTASPLSSRHAPSEPPRLHAHIHSLMGTPSYVARWADRSERGASDHKLIDPDALADHQAARSQRPDAAPAETKATPVQTRRSRRRS